MFRQDCTCPALLENYSNYLLIRGYHPLWPDFPDRSVSTTLTTGLFRFRSPLLAESLLMSFPPGTEMFQFPGFASTTYVFSCRYPRGWVAPFGYPRIKACSRLPMAFRSVPRPSSPPGAKASTECPSLARDQERISQCAPHHAQKPSSGISRQLSETTGIKLPTPMPGTDPHTIFTQHTTVASELPPPGRWALASCETALPVRLAAERISSHPPRHPPSELADNRQPETGN